MQPPPIVAKELRKVYCDGNIEVTAVDSANIVFQAGQVIGLFGPSGSGKTTLLSMLGCILRPTSGSLKIFDKETAALNEDELPEVRRNNISFVFQGFNLFPALTVLDNVTLALTLKGYGEDEAEQKACKMLEAVGLSQRINFLPRDLSGGQKQRVAVARALAADAKIILADEPTGNLDLLNGRKVMELLGTLAAQKGCCVVVATHDNRIEDVFQRILVMQDGQIVDERWRLP